MSHLHSAPSTPSPTSEASGGTDPAENPSGDTGGDGASDDQPDERTGLHIELKAFFDLVYGPTTSRDREGAVPHEGGYRSPSHIAVHENDNGSRPQGCQLDPSHLPWLRTELLRLANILDIDSGCVSVAIVDDQRMAALHERYKAVPGTTDVLTFDLRDNPADPIDADIVICWDEAMRQAAARGHDAPREALLYALHGLLHLLGYDDHDPNDAAAMHRKEDEVLTAAGFGPVFDKDRGNSQGGPRP